MKAAKRGSENHERERAAQSLDSGDARAVMLAAAGLTVFLYFIKLILLPFVLSAILAYICTPAVDWLAKRTRWPRLLFAVLFFLGILAIAGLFATFAATRIVAQAAGLGTDLQALLAKFFTAALGSGQVQFLGHTLNADQIAQTAVGRISNWISQTDHLALFAGYSLGAVMGVFLSAVLLFYFLVSGERIARGLLWLAPPHRRGLVRRIWSRLDPVLMHYFVGMIVVVIYATTASYIGLDLVLGIRHAVLLALLSGILETVPVIGPTSAAVIAGLVSLQTATGIMSIVDYALYATALRLSIDQLVGPIVLGTAAHVHPVLIIFCFLAGGVVFGIPGIILAVPVALLIKSTLATLYGDPRE
jgi:predicted PurR-regulated permease PerM